MEDQFVHKCPAASSEEVTPGLRKPKCIFKETVGYYRCVRRQVIFALTFAVKKPKTILDSPPEATEATDDGSFGSLAALPQS